MKRCWPLLQRAAVVALADAALVTGGPVTGTKQSTRLYTAPDPSAGGGIVLRLPATAPPLRAAIAVPGLSRERAYLGRLGTDARSAEFAGLPTDRYDLMLVFDDWFAEGLLLSRDPDSLGEADRRAIRETVDRSVPFFDTKVIHRCEGVGGRGGRAAAVLQEVRTRPITLQDASVRTDIQIRSLKLAFFEEVGPGWHLVRTRELLRQEVGPGETKGVLRHAFVPVLQGVRVMDSVRDLGEIQLPPSRR
ncbi:MAG: hypothetical protein N2652_09855 [Kiritimatiellae bacterium]|nr:hypothetical protein [Kiritimatiellia bacterium]